MLLIVTGKTQLFKNISTFFTFEFINGHIMFLLWNDRQYDFSNLKLYQDIEP